MNVFAQVEAALAELAKGPTVDDVRAKLQGGGAIGELEALVSLQHCLETGQTDLIALAVSEDVQFSGKWHRRWHWRWQCPTFLRQTFVEWAGQTINKSFWAGAYYRQQREKGSSYQAAVRALAFKWIRILYRCWVSRTPYDETTYLNALRKRGSPLLNNLTLNP